MPEKRPGWAYHSLEQLVNDGRGAAVLSGAPEDAWAAFTTVLHYGRDAKDVLPGWDGWLMWVGRVEAAARAYAITLSRERMLAVLNECCTFCLECRKRHWELGELCDRHKALRAAILRGEWDKKENPVSDSETRGHG